MKFIYFSIVLVLILCILNVSAQNIKDGIYMLACETGTKKCLSLNQNGNVMLLPQNTSNTVNTFFVSNCGNKIDPAYTIRANTIHSSRYLMTDGKLMVKQKSPKLGKYANIYCTLLPPTANNNFRWQFKPAKDGSYYIVNQGNGKYLVGLFGNLLSHQSDGEYYYHWHLKKM